MLNMMSDKMTVLMKRRKLRKKGLTSKYYRGIYARGKERWDK